VRGFEPIEEKTVSTTQIARRLRRRQTDAERYLWFKLRNQRLGGLKFRRQMQLNGFVVDFCCPDAKLIIEVDGGQHALRSEQDLLRTKNLETSGYLVLRFWNNDVLRNIDGVLEEILRTVNQQAFEPPRPTPLPQGEREPA
jgi:very-short-patch-repair endonuclease